MGAAGVWHAKQPYREHHYTSYSWLSDDSNDDIHFIISITKQLLFIIKAITSHRTLLKTFLIRPEKHAPKILRLLVLVYRQTSNALTCVVCRSLEILSGRSLRKSSHAGRDFLCKKQSRQSERERVRERENYDRHRRTKSTTFEFDAFFFFFSERQQ